MFSRFDTIPACDGRTDRRTDGRTDGRTDVQPISITCFSIADARKYYTLKKTTNQLWRYLVSFARYSDFIGRKSRNFYTTPVFSSPAEGDPVGIS